MTSNGDGSFVHVCKLDAPGVGTRLVGRQVNDDDSVGVAGEGGASIAHAIELVGNLMRGAIDVENTPVVGHLVEGMAGRLGGSYAALGADRDVVVDDRFVGDGYGIPTEGSREALTMVARHEGVVLDPVYTAKAMAGLIERIRRDSFSVGESVLFWHTGGQVGLFA